MLNDYQNLKGKNAKAGTGEDRNTIEHTKLFILLNTHREVKCFFVLIPTGGGFVCPWG